MISIDNIGIFLSSPAAIFENYNKGYLNLPNIFTRKFFLCVKCLKIFSIFSCVLNVLEFFSILELETLMLNTYGNTNNKNIKNIYILTQCLVDRQCLGGQCGFPASGRIGKGRLSLCFKRNGNYLCDTSSQIPVHHFSS